MTAKRAPLPPIALLDWGIGGLSVRQALGDLRPHMAVTYVSDAGFTPYGLLSPKALHERLGRWVDALAERGVRRVFLACNAASTALARPADFSLPVTGMIEPGVQVLRALRPQCVGIVAGRRTVQSRVYRAPLASVGIAVMQRIAQPLSAAIERGECDTEATRALVRRVVAPLANVDAILLACTHYPAAMRAFQHALPHMRFVDPAHQAAHAMVQACDPRDMIGGEDHVITSGDAEAMRCAAAAAFSLALTSIETFTLS